MLSWERSFNGKAQEYFGKGDYQLAENALRAELTRYIGWIFKHTLILMRHPSGPPLELLRIDLGALENFAERIGWVFEMQGKRESILHTFDHLVATMPLPGLIERMAYLKCVWLAHKFNDKAGAERVLSKWPVAEQVSDFRLLQVWFEMRSDSLSVVERIKIVSRIVGLSNSPVEKLHYSIVKTMLFALLGEYQEARRLHTEALNMFLATAAEIAQEGDWYAASICAQAMEVQGMLSKDLMAFERGVGFLDKVSISKLNGKGKSELFYQRGRLSWLKNDWAQAIKDFSDSLNECSNVLSLIYRLDCYVRLDELEKGRSDLAKLRALGVPEEFRLELLRSAAALVVKAGEVEGARSLVEELKGLKLGILNFAAQRDELCVNLLEFAAQEVGRKPSAAAKRASMLARIQKVASYFELKPNFFGLGLNLNRVFEAKEEKK